LDLFNDLCVDDGCTASSTPRKELLRNYEQFDQPMKLEVADDHTLDVLGKAV